MRRLVCLALMVLAAGVYLYHIEYFPPADSDEAGFLDIPYRMSVYGDCTYPIQVQSAFNSTRVRKYPPLLAFWLRGAFHAVVGFSPASSRFFSAAVLWLCLLVGAVWTPASLFGDNWRRLLPVLTVGLAPPVIMAARTVRFEQEIFFLGFMACLGLPWLAAKLKGRRGGYPIWFLSGFFAGWAACSHFFGIIFPVVFVFCLVWQRRAWAELDGLGSWRRFWAWAAGAAAPVGLTAGVMLADLNNFAGYTHMMGQIYASRESQLHAWFMARAGWLKAVFPPFWAIHIRELEYSGYFSYIPYPFARWFVIIFFVESVGAAAYGLWSLRKKFSGARVYIFTVVWLALGFLVFNFLYPANTNYFLYLGFLVPLAFSLAALDLAERMRPGRVGLARALCGLPLLLVVFQAGLAVHHAGAYTLQVRRYVAEKRPAPLDDKFRAVSRLAKALEVPKVKGPVYCDFMTWAGAGRAHRSLFESVVFGLGSIPPKVGAVLLETGFFEPHLYHFPEAKSGSPDPELRSRRFGRLLKSTSLAGVILGKGADYSEFMIYLEKDRAPRPLLAGELRGLGVIEWRRAGKTIPPSQPRPGRGGCRWAGLQPGDYLLQIGPGPEMDGRKLRVRFAEDGEAAGLRELTIALGPIHRYIPKMVPLRVRSRGDALEITGDAEGGGLACEKITLRSLEPTNLAPDPNKPR